MRSYTSEFFDIRRFGSDMVLHTNSKKKRVLDALMLVLTVFQMSLQISHEITGISMLNLCAELVDGLFAVFDKYHAASNCR